jgi:hypothetical protein
LSESGGVTTPIGFNNLNIVMARQPLMNHDRITGSDRRGKGVDDEQDAQGIDGISGLRRGSLSKTTSLGSPVREKGCLSVTIDTL